MHRAEHHAGGVPFGNCTVACFACSFAVHPTSPWFDVENACNSMRTMFSMLTHAALKLKRERSDAETKFPRLF